MMRAIMCNEIREKVINIEWGREQRLRPQINMTEYLSQHHNCSYPLLVGAFWN